MAAQPSGESAAHLSLLRVHCVSSSMSLMKMLNSTGPSISLWGSSLATVAPQMLLLPLLEDRGDVCFLPVPGNLFQLL